MSVSTAQNFQAKFFTNQNRALAREPSCDTVYAMELETTLKSQSVQNRIREAGINPNYWYPVAWSHQLEAGEVLPVTVWQRAIVLFRDADGRPHALEDACPHKGVALHKGEVKDSNLTCPYHGWEFNGDGECVGIPYLPADRKLPCAKAPSYPLQERYGMIWVFPGDARLADTSPLPDIPEYDDPRYFPIRIPGEFQAHFSICNENTMDVFHGYLHRDLQGWFDPVLLNLEQGDRDVRADYRVSYRGWLSKVLGLGKNGDGVTTRTVSVHYCYPHYHSALEGVSSLYLNRLPVNETLTRSFSLLFLKLPVPKFLRQGPLGGFLEQIILNRVFLPFLNQDVDMMESEQRTYLANPQRQYVEINPAIIALQRVTISQYEKSRSEPLPTKAVSNGKSASQPTPQ